MKNKSSLYRALWRHLSLKRKKQVTLLLVLMFISSLAEVISIGSILPFLGALTNPDSVFQHGALQPLIKFINIDNSSQLLLPLTILFILAALLSGLIRLLLLYLLTRISFAIGADLSVKSYRNTLYQDYMVHVSRNSSTVIAGVIGKIDTVIGSVLTPILILISSFVFMVGIIAVLFFIDAIVASTAFLFFGAMYWIVISFTRRQLKENSKCIAKQSVLKVKSLQEGLGGIRDVLLDGAQEFYCKLYRDADLPLRKALGNNLFIASFPRYAMEAIGMSFIAILAYMLVQATESVIPVLGAIALGTQRLLPVLQQAYSSYSSIKGAQSSLYDVVHLLDQKIHNNTLRKLSTTPLKFETCIELRNVSFRYTKKTPWVLKNINLTINKGDCVGFVGSTGNGKSTLIDIIMGLLVPTEGEIVIDGKTIISDSNVSLWQMNIAHVPQSIYLSDGSIEDNIAFGVTQDEIDRQRVKNSAIKANISEKIESLTKDYETLVGEQGVKLSGGERQRIGIARAFYKNTNTLIFDEATSALDIITEKKIMKSIGQLGKDTTILIIAHRITTLNDCNFLVKIDDGGKSSIVSYKDFVDGFLI